MSRMYLQNIQIVETIEEADWQRGQAGIPEFPGGDDKSVGRPQMSKMWFFEVRDDWNRIIRRGDMGWNGAPRHKWFSQLRIHLEAAP